VEAAVEKVKSFTSAKFDQTVECVLLLGIDPKQADQLVRGSLSLPHGVGKQKKVIAFCDDSEVEAARQAGAIEAGSDELVDDSEVEAARQAGAVEAGSDELVKKITDGWADFDVAIASPKVMGKVGRLGRIRDRRCGHRGR